MSNKKHNPILEWKRIIDIRRNKLRGFTKEQLINKLMKSEDELQNIIEDMAGSSL